MKGKKKCTRCGHERRLACFTADSRNRDGKRSECKLCNARMNLNTLKKRVAKLEKEYKK